MATRKVYTTTKRTGAGTDTGTEQTVSAMTAISKDIAADGDFCFILEDDDTGFYAYKYNAAGTAATSAPDVYRPNNYTTAGNWENQPSPFGGRAYGNPFFHGQDQKAYNVDGGASVADTWTTRVINSTLHNSIAGATLTDNVISLPAGTYYVEATGLHHINNQTNRYYSGIFDGSTLLLMGLPLRATIPTGTAAGGEASVSGLFVLASTGAITLKYYAGLALSTGLGINNNGDSIVDSAIPSVYADIKIWQLTDVIEYTV